MHVSSTCPFSSSLTFLSHWIRLSGWKRKSSFRIRALGERDWRCSGSRMKVWIDSLLMRERMSVMVILVKRRFLGGRIGHGMSWNGSLETSEAISLDHVSVYLFQHFRTNLALPLAVEGFSVPLAWLSPSLISSPPVAL